MPQILSPEILQRKNAANLAVVAASMNDLDTVKEIISLGVDIRTAKQPSGGGTPLMIASQYGYKDIVEFLVPHVDVNAQDKEGRTAAFMAASFNQPEIIQILNNAGGNLNTPMNDGATPTIIAALKGNFEAIETLIGCDANLNQANFDGLTPLFGAAQNGHKNIVAELLAHRVSPDVDTFRGITPAYVAAQNGHSYIIELLVSHHANINKPSPNGTTPIHVAVEFRHIDTVKILIKYKANVNARGADGITPVFLTCIDDNVELLKLLVENGADLNERYDGSTILFIAALYGQVSIVDFLLEKDINLENLPNIKTSTELISLAQSFKSEAIVHQMEEFIQTQLKNGVSPDQIVILPRDLAYITNQHEIVTLFDLHHSRKVISNAKETTHQLRDEINNVSVPSPKKFS